MILDDGCTYFHHFPRYGDHMVIQCDNDHSLFSLCVDFGKQGNKLYYTQLFCTFVHVNVHLSLYLLCDKCKIL